MDIVAPSGVSPSASFARITFTETEDDGDDIWPVRCYWCGRVIDPLCRRYHKELQRIRYEWESRGQFSPGRDGKWPEGLALDSIGLIRECCRLAPHYRNAQSQHQDLPPAKNTLFKQRDGTWSLLESGSRKC